MPKSKQSWISIPVSSDTVESEGRQMKQCWIKYIKKPNKIPFLFRLSSSKAKLYQWKEYWKKPKLIGPVLELAPILLSQITLTPLHLRHTQISMSKSKAREADIPAVLAYGWGGETNPTKGPWVWVSFNTLSKLSCWHYVRKLFIKLNAYLSTLKNALRAGCAGWIISTKKQGIKTNTKMIEEWFKSVFVSLLCVTRLSRLYLE